MSTTRGASPDNKKSDEQGNNGVRSVANVLALSGATAPNAAATQQNPAAATSFAHHDALPMLSASSRSSGATAVNAAATHQNSAAATSFAQHGAPPMLSTSSRSSGATASNATTTQQHPAAATSFAQHGAPPMLSASSRSASTSYHETAQTSEMHHHPDLPFLVTHWLSHYAPPSLSKEFNPPEEMPQAMGEIVTVRKDQTEEKEEAVRKIWQAASSLASAFQTLGAFGHSSRVTTPSFSRPTTYSDMSRKYFPLLSTAFSSSHESGGNGSSFSRKGNRRVALLDEVVSASSSANAAVATSDLKCSMPWSLLEAAHEGSVPTEGSPNGQVRETTRNGAGRRVGGSLSVDAETTMDSLVPSEDVSGSAMQKPILLGTNDRNATAGLSGTTSIHAAQASRRKNSLRIEVSLQRKQMECTMQTRQSAIKHAKTGKSNTFPAARRSVDQLDQLDADSDLDLHRVVAQLERRMHELHLNHSCAKAKVVEAEMEANKSFSDFASIRRQYQDSYRINGEQESFHQILRVKSGQRNLGFGPLSHTPGKNNIALASVLTRQYHGRYLSSSYSQNHLSVLKSRLSHAVTFSCHLIYPVYCLKFDRTGKYFITGADDQVAKLFHLGAGRKEVCCDHDGSVDNGTESQALSFNYGANVRGAILVCALRGHAGVVTDIDVNVDNALLATASGDGDVRVWGLKNGYPVAILRGHKDGANMVSWSTFTPFQLVTCGEDGLARMWDVRKAALKRYGDFIDNWSYYSWPEQVADTAHQDIDIEMKQKDCTQTLQPNPLHPPLQEGRREDDPSLNLDGIGFGRNIGGFVSNDRIDEGVTLIAQLQHGTLVEENQLQGRVTRTSGKSVKVMCIARCPMGCHFATGSDDGLGRVWADDDDWHVERLDNELSDFDPEDGMARHSSISTFLRRKTKLKSSIAPSEERLLATLRGHSNAVTDMKYSNAGDRILTASMKDGVVCVWSWGKEGAMTSVGKFVKAAISDFHQGPIYAKFSNVSQLSIQLTHVSGGGASTDLTSRQKAASVNCDGVTWTCDDMKIVTSQSRPAKGSSTDIIPGSHMIYIWDSHSGKCLMGIMSSHSSLCSALAPHPTLSSVVASAGSDGVVNVWDLDRGDCFFTHTNTLLHGPAEPATNRGKKCGYLDTQFSPDGLNLVVTDENGRVTILDTLVQSSRRSGTDTVVTGRYSMTPFSLFTPEWMGEQYFANDYYELVYDNNGYCTERGSEQPPHLAPEGVRCTHEGISHSEIIRGTYSKLEGPLPLPENSVRWYRDDIRAHSIQARMSGVLSGNTHKKAKKVVRNTERNLGRASTAIITMGGQLFQHERKDSSFTNSSFRVSGNARNRNLNDSTSTGRQLSSRYRWVDSGDLPETEDENEDCDDEDYDGIGRNSSIHNLEENSSEDDTDVSVVSRPHQRQQSVSGRGQSGRSRRRESTTPARESQEQRQPARASSRHTAQQTYLELNSDDELLTELISTHTTPSGNFSEDWEQHLFKMPRGEGSIVRRNWVSRTSSQGNVLGQNFYCPQVGDSVVYIPRAHYDTIQKFPVCIDSKPWKSWPTHSSWPVVCCKVTHIRYRFPYKTYYKSRRQDEKLQGVAAVLTLEISGVPSLLPDHNFPWPVPNFISLSNNSIQFEVTVFECNEVDFIIPEYLYSWRIKELERAIIANDGNASGLPFTVHCPPDHGHDCHSTEDADYDGYTGQLVQINQRSEDEPRFVDSGYNALSIKWDTNEESVDMNELSVFPTWHITMNPSCDAPVVPTMGEDVRRAVTAALGHVTKLDPKVKELFDDHVDTRKYADYLEMIEVPMHLSLIQKRLRSNYYTNKSSVVADMELVKENCYKYNEDGNGFYKMACQMYNTFKNLVDSIEEPQSTTIEENSQIHSRTSTSAVVNSDMLTVQKRHPVGCASGVRQQSIGDGIPILDSVGDSSLPRTIAHDNIRAEAEACTQTGISKQSYAEISNGMDRHHQETESQTKVQSHCKPSSDVQAEENGVHRLTPCSAQQLQLTEAGGPSRNMHLRERRKPSYAGKDLEEEVKLESSGGEKHDASEVKVSIEEDTPKAEPCAQAGSIKKVDTESSDDEDGLNQEEESQTEVQSSCKPNSDAQVAENVAHRLTRPSVQQLQSEEVVGPSRRIHSRARRKPSYADTNLGDTEISDGDDGHNHEEESQTNVQSSWKPNSDVQVAENLAHRQTRQSAQQLQLAESGGPSRRIQSRAKPKPSYAEKDSDEEEYVESSSEDETDESDEDSTEEEVSHRKRNRRHTNDGPLTKKRGRALSPKNDSLNYPDLAKWPPVSGEFFSEVGVAVLDKLKDSDPRTLFSRPVCEEFPYMAEEYLNKIRNPMDFRTIEHERMHTYDNNIAKLQEDLIVTFRNCCVFNGERSEYYSYSLDIWKSLNDIFHEVCTEKKIGLPRNFS